MTTWIVLGSMLAGMGIGYLLRRQALFLKIWDRIAEGTVFLLLFLLGLSVGTNELIFSSLGTVGLTALWMSFGALVGSIFLSWITYIFFFKKES